MRLPQPENSVSVIEDTSGSQRAAHVGEVLPTVLTGEEVLNEFADDDESIFAPEGHFRGECSLCELVSMAHRQGEYSE